MMQNGKIFFLHLESYLLYWKKSKDPDPYKNIKNSKN